LYHHDCSECQKAITEYQQMARDLQGNEDFLQIALIEVPPYGHGVVGVNSICLSGKLDDSKERFVSTPVTALSMGGRIISVWEDETPRLDEAIGAFSANDEYTKEWPRFHCKLLACFNEGR